MNLPPKEICTGCAACNNICPETAISMQSDNEGFDYPYIDELKCVKCGLCEKVCPVLHKYENTRSTEKPKIFAAWSLDEKTRLSSTSGGVFSELAKLVFENDGVAAGARYNENNDIEHFIINNVNELDKLRQSKYAQSRIGLIYVRLKDYLDAGKEVLFCGAPCQNAALASYLKRDYDSLITCDFICKGVNSPKVYRKYLDMLEKKYKSKVETVHFKNKTFGWNRFSTKVNFENGEYYLKDRYSDLFMVGYIEKNLYLRPSCHNCFYKGLPRVSDITLGDFWGLKEKHPELDEDKGTSVVFLNTQKGLDFFERLNGTVFKRECVIEDVLGGNLCLDSSAPAHKNRQAFFESLDTLPFDKLIKKYGGKNKKAALKRFVYIKAVKLKKRIFGFFK